MHDLLEILEHAFSLLDGFFQYTYNYMYIFFNNMCNIVVLISTSPRGDPGVKSRMCPRYPHACHKRRLKWGAVL